MIGVHICEQRFRWVVGVRPFEPGTAHLNRVTLPPLSSRQTKAEFDAFAVGKMKKAAVADGLAGVSMQDQPLAEAMMSLMFAVAMDAAARVLQGEVCTAGMSS